MLMGEVKQERLYRNYSSVNANETHFVLHKKDKLLRINNLTCRKKKPLCSEEQALIISIKTLVTLALNQFCFILE